MKRSRKVPALLPAPGLNDWMPALERFERLRPTFEMLDEHGRREPHKSLWLTFSILSIPGIDSYPSSVRTRWADAPDGLAQARSRIAWDDWKARCKRKRKIRTRVRRIVIERAGDVCFYCGFDVPEHAFVIDHVVPISRGGRGNLRNLVAACWDCNADKGDLLLDEWRPQDRGITELVFRRLRECPPGALAGLMQAASGTASVTPWPQSPSSPPVATRMTARTGTRSRGPTGT